MESSMKVNIITNTISTMPLMALRALTVMPKMLISFDVGRQASIRALDTAMKGDRLIALSAQKDASVEKPEQKDLYRIGVVAKVRQMLKISENTVRVLIEGLYRCDLLTVDTQGKYLRAQIVQITEPHVSSRSARLEAACRVLKDLFSQYTALIPAPPAEIMANVESEKDAGNLADYICSNTLISFDKKQQVLEEISHYNRIKTLIDILRNEIKVLQYEQQLQQKVKEQIDQNQHDYFLREQIKAIQEELGEVDDITEDRSYYDRIDALGLPQASAEKLCKEVDRLLKMPPMSHDGAVLRNYLDTVLDLPFNEMTKDRLSLSGAEKILNRDHYGMEKVKERILEFLAVRQMTQVKGQILCLAGPPGVGKTSIARSIAEAMGRKFARVSLGGVRDEAEIRGHRKTYIGAMPGRIIAAVQSAGSKNPVLLLDEIDKLCNDYHGDPSAALLEVLDSEQNATFVDHYVEIPFDLSDVFFITTANTLDTIPRALLDRMDVVEMSSYLTYEKIEICKRHLIPKQRKAHGLTALQIKFETSAIKAIIEGYTRESGVRNVERLISTVMRKTAKGIVDKKYTSMVVRKNGLEQFLKQPIFRDEENFDPHLCGIANGLAWTSVGGEMLQVEISVMEGSGKLELTGCLGDVMKESAHIAFSLARKLASVYDIDADFYKTKDFHIHFPEGAVPKDGPSAGVTICSALLSALSGIPVSNTVAMTGEISLTGRVLPIGGLREKTMAALQHGIHTVIIPKGNVKDTEQMDKEITDKVKFVAVSSVEEVLATALICMPPKKETERTRQDEAPKM